MGQDGGEARDRSLAPPAATNRSGVENPEQTSLLKMTQLGQLCLTCKSDRASSVPHTCRRHRTGPE